MFLDDTQVAEATPVEATEATPTEAPSETPTEGTYVQA